MPQENGPVHLECSTTRNVMASASEVELGGFIEKIPKRNIHTDKTIINIPPKTTNAIGNRQHNGK